MVYSKCDLTSHITGGTLLKTEVIEVSSVNFEVYSRLRRQIVYGKIAPGAQISIRQIAEAFDVSTMPVREALRKLQAEGFVQFKTRSVIVRKLSPDEIKELFAIRQRLELLAYEWSLPLVTDKHLDALRKILASLDEACEDIETWNRLNREFHFRFYRLSESAPLIQMIENIWDAVEPYMHRSNFSSTELRFAQTQHNEILRLIEQRDLESLSALTDEHLKGTYRAIIGAM
jgi:DNA-binding GntR family transcriptional regulator